MPPSALTRYPGRPSSRPFIAALVLIAASLAAPPLHALDEVLWERFGGWAPSGTTYFTGARCEVEASGGCPREMGWQGNDITWSSGLPADADRTPRLRFELVVDRVFEPVTLTVRIGPSGGPLEPVGTLAIDAVGVHRLLVDSEYVQGGARNEIHLAGDCAVGFGEPSGIRWRAAGLYRHYETPPSVPDLELLDATQWRACRYFLEQVTAGSLPLDTAGGDTASLAAVGFGATVMTIVADRFETGPRWTIPAEEARACVVRMLEGIRDIQERQESDEEAWGYAGIPYHFMDPSGRRARASEVSTVDGALMLIGCLQAGAYFGGEVAQKADAIFRSVDLERFYRPERGRYSHGWTPEQGLLEYDWDRPGDETLLVCLLSLAQDPVDPDRLRACYGYPRVVESYGGIPVVRSYFGSLFTYTFAHFWLPFECFGRDRPAEAGVSGLPAVDWWENSVRAVEANRRYHRDRLPEFPALGEESFGASACYRADRLEYFGPNGAAPAEAEPAFDGTLPPYGAIMSLDLARTSENEVLRDNPAFRALRHYYDTRFSTLWCGYGPRSSFDHRGNTSLMVVGVEKGPEALGIEAYRSGMPARTLLSHPAIQAALSRLFEHNTCPQTPPVFTRGHVNEDRVLDISDPVFLLDHLFRGGPPPECADAADSNDDGEVDLSDAVALFSFLFLGGPAPPEPFPIPGTDPTPDNLPVCQAS